MVFRLSEESVGFPDPRLGETSGLFAIGGDLRFERLIQAYSHGIFPWSSFRAKELHWYCPMQRFVLFPDEIKISHSMRNLINKEQYFVSFDRAFDEVLYNCATVDDRHKESGAWLGEEIMKAWLDLHRRGISHSVEVWDRKTNRLVGGLYGQCIGNIFIGESMFSHVPSASKLALIALAQYAKEENIKFIDCQNETPHLRSMGGRFIPYEQYMKVMDEYFQNSDLSLKSIFSKKAVLFDMDGILFDSMPNHATAWVEAFRRVGVNFSERDVYLMEGSRGKDTVQFAFNRQFGYDSKEEDEERIYAIKSSVFRQQPIAPPMKDIEKVLSFLKNKNVKMTIVTGSGEYSTLDRIQECFPNTFVREQIVTAYDVSKGKPNPEPYLKGLQKLGVTAAETIVVENAPLGVKAGKAAGCFTIGVNTGILQEDDLLAAGADLVFKDMNMLLHFFQKHICWVE